MIQSSLKLSTNLKLLLKECEELWIATALISDKGYAFIQDHIHKKAKQYYLVGIDLPSSAKVLSDMMTRDDDVDFKSRIYKKSQFFHPKVFVIRSGGHFTAFVGSGNCTIGGLTENIELSVIVEDQIFCTDLIKWFDKYFNLGIPITLGFLQSYSDIYERRKERMKQDRRDLIELFPDYSVKTDLDSLDFTNQYFKKEHYLAFEGSKPTDRSASANNERNNVRGKLFRLHDKLYPAIKKKGWDLHEHYVYEDTVSSSVHGEYTSDRLDGLWLHYGRNRDQIKAFGENKTPLDFMRLEVIIHIEKGVYSVGIWNRVGKDMGSRLDREYFVHMMKYDNQYSEKFFQLISELPNEFYIHLNGQWKYAKEFMSPDELKEFVIHDNLSHYFIIGREYEPDDTLISEENIASTIIAQFSFLYPIFELMKVRL